MNAIEAIEARLPRSLHELLIAKGAYTLSGSLPLDAQDEAVRVYAGLLTRWIDAAANALLVQSVDLAKLKADLAEIADVLAQADQSDVNDAEGAATDMQAGIAEACKSIRALVAKIGT